MSEFLIDQRITPLDRQMESGDQNPTFLSKMLIVFKNKKKANNGWQNL